ncbi:flagellin N-terminal helical domain-containing protein [Bradyrhizobium sp. AZCC 2289]|uniref:flagellin N-terminal helical domain-containing protein n=1 Tax=Bradyrhizobium sp. AZCC 2289 TaxID=3117026 RepID=UPI002FEF1963
MSGIVLSASVRQNLLSLQDTAALLSTTQNRLATGNKVNSALDNPTNFFTAQGLNNRASDINNLLDSIGNGVQVLQAANTGLTSLQKLVDTAKSIANQVLQAPAGYTAKSTVTSAAAIAGTAANLVDGTDIKSGQTLSVAANGELPAVTVTFGATETLDQLNTALAAGGVTASLDSSNKLVLTTTNDYAGQTIGAVTVGSTPGTTTFGAAVAPVADAASQAIRASLVGQYNNIITQITTTSQDSSFNGINLLNGDNLKLTFDETGKSTLNITGVTYDAAGLGLGSLTTGTDFLDNASANAALTKLSSASTTLRTEASALGSNLSVVQLRQDFNKNLINVLQTGASNLTLADSNEEAANSQALSTRQSIATSALALANTSQQSVLQLLR